jgi:hypothetical protein
MTIPAGAGGESAGSRQQTHVPDDADDPGLPAATGNSAAGGPQTGEIQGGGPVTDAVRDQEPSGMGSAEYGDAVGSEDPSGI